ncbi:MAG: cupin domain-containing protein [Methanocalculus sp.]|uniref:cupin domain-containing protein n=1 Tax=Methanocalculus sp. TaxID=2004547 RepID=UPI002725B7EA|nr:cupin domain-containing protein [Methanocalculus sp.]MDO9540337.1 cupin domain-containing protein [Methanocalculus sp.]
MRIFDLKQNEHERAGDLCLLAELFHPERTAPGVASRYSLAHAIILAGEATIPHRLKASSEVYYILSGRGVMHIDDEVAEIGVGQLVYIPPGAVQWVENRGDEDLVFLAIVDPAWREEDEEVISDMLK